MKKIDINSFPRGQRMEYTLKGVVELVNDNSVLVRKEHSNTFFWVDRAGCDCDLEKGETGIFHLHINTFVSTKGEPMGLVKTKLRLCKDVYRDLPTPSDQVESHMKTLLVDIDEIVRTEIHGLYLMILTAKSNNERIYARFYSPTEFSKTYESRTVKLRLMKSRTTITRSGDVYEDQKTKSEDIGVGTITNTYQTWFTWLEIAEID